MSYRPIMINELNELVKETIFEFRNELKFSLIQAVDLTLNEYSKALTYSKAHKVLILGCCLRYLFENSLNSQNFVSDYSKKIINENDTYQLIKLNNSLLQNLPNFSNESSEESDYILRLTTIYVNKANDLVKMLSKYITNQDSNNKKNSKTELNFIDIKKEIFS